MRILMVCLGNICRSPLAEGILRKKANEAGLQLFIDSAGTSGWHAGDNPDKRSIANAKKHQVDISQLVSRQFIVNDFDRFDTIYVMDSSNYNDVLSLARNEEDRQKVKLILNELYPGKNMAVPDPYYGGEQGFENVFQLLDKACGIITQNLANSSL